MTDIRFRMCVVHSDAAASSDTVFGVKPKESIEW